MPISTELMRTELMLIKPLLTSASLETSRMAQDKVGSLMAGTQRRGVTFATQVFKNFTSAWALPKRQTKSGVILYIHGGGYVAGNQTYAKGFGAVLAARHGIRVFCPAYRLAPEFPFPAATEDALTAYTYLLDCGYSGCSILLCGESAGGGLVFAMAAMLAERGLPAPCGIVSISPWCDLTLSGDTLEINRETDALSPEQLEYFASMYCKDTSDPLVSPLFADPELFPPALIFAGSGEILLDDAIRMHKRLVNAGRVSRLFIGRDMWHAYVLYGVKASVAAHNHISEFMEQYMNE